MTNGITTTKEAKRNTKANPLPELVAALNRESENDFLSWCIDYARLKHWRIAHFRGAWSKDGKRYTTPVQGDGKGFPDLCLVRGNRLIFAELKSNKGKVSAEQYDWLEALGKAKMEVFIWRPEDRLAIEALLDLPRREENEK